MSSTSVSAQETTPAVSASPVIDSAAIDRAIRAGFGLPADTQAPGTVKPNREADRRCPGCPIRRMFRPYVESTALNFMYNGINRYLERDKEENTAIVTWKSIYTNLRHGFEWDKNAWGTNQIGHPFQGSNYYTSGRAHGLTFYESTAVAAFGSASWEYFFENNRASLNDFINTTLGGIALGEVMHRLGWLIRGAPVSQPRDGLRRRTHRPKQGPVRRIRAGFHCRRWQPGFTGQHSRQVLRQSVRQERQTFRSA